jgi:hypothetical protein
VKKRLLIALVAIAAGLCVAGGQASADPESNHGTSGLTSPALLALIVNDDVFATADLTTVLATPGMNATQHYGPYPSSSPDSGTCGNDWATDMFDRHFTVRQDAAGTFTVVQQYKNGSFVTDPPTQPSPGSCDLSDGSPPGTVDPGIVGSMHGYLIVPLPVGTMQTSTSPYCNATAMTDANCDTTTFINTHFTPCYQSTCSASTYFFHYAAGDQGQVEHEWKNASDDRGGNHGDIRSTNLP